MTRLRNRFSDKEIRDAFYSNDKSFSKAAKFLSQKNRGKVSRQAFTYWINSLRRPEPIENELDRGRGIERELLLSTHNNRLRRDVRLLARQNDVLRGFIKKLSVCKVNLVHYKPNNYIGDKPKITVEALFSDLQIGKLSSNYNSKIAADRVREYGDKLVSKLLDLSKTQSIECLKLALIGDIIESDKKHKNSGRACDIGTAEQLERATTLIVELISKLALLPINKIDVICVTGNHDWDGHGLATYQAGQEHLSWVMFNALKLIIGQVIKEDKIEFIIPRGTFYVDTIYNMNVLYEHGVGVAPTESGMSTRRGQRSQQVDKLIHCFRMGDKHNISRFNNDALVVNGAFFGGDNDGSEYSSQLGYHNVPSQLCIIHKRDSIPQIQDSFTITFER